MKRWLLMILVVFWALPMVAQIDADIHYKANARYWGIGSKEAFPCRTTITLPVASRGKT